MAKKENPEISITKLEKIMKANFETQVTESWFGVDIIIKRSLSLTEMIQFCKEIAENCFTDSGEFIPEVMDFTIKSGVLTRYANFRLPENLEEQYKLIYNTDAYETVVQRINHNQLDEIVGAANRKVKHLCDSDVFGFRSKMTDLIGLFEGMQKQTENIFNGFTSEDIKTLMSAVDKTGTMSEEKIVEAYINKMKEDSVADEYETEDNS